MNRFCSFRSVFLMVVSLGVVVGCEKPIESNRPKPTKTVKIDELPELDDHIGPLDNGRLEVAPPAGWHVPPRSSKYIARFQESEEGSYPSIIITGEDSHDGFSVTKKNVGEFARHTASDLKKDKKTAKLADSVLPVEVGSFVGVIYKRRGRAPLGFKRVIVDRLVTETIVDGRKYVIELRAREGDAAGFQPHLLAVLGGLKFVDSGGRKTLDDLLGDPSEETVAEKPKKPEPKEPTPKKEEPKKPEPKKPEPNKPEPKKEEPKKPEPKEPEPKKPEPKEEQPKKPESKKDG